MQIRLTSEQAERLRDRAHQRRMSAAGLVREAVDAALRDVAGEMSIQERWHRSRNAVGRYGSGRPDQVSVDHDGQLEGTYRS